MLRTGTKTRSLKMVDRDKMLDNIIKTFDIMIIEFLQTLFDFNGKDEIETEIKEFEKEYISYMLEFLLIDHVGGRGYTSFNSHRLRLFDVIEHRNLYSLVSYSVAVVIKDI